MIKKRIYLISALAALFIVLTLAYIFIVAPLLEEAEANKIPTLIEGEVLGPANAILMFDQVERDNIQKIEVHNSLDDYSFSYYPDDKDFFLDEYKSAPYSKEMFSSLVVSAGFPTTMTRVTEKCENFAEYGLAPENDPAYYVLTTRDNVQHKVYIGKQIPTGAGFYAKYDGRDAVYVLEASISQTLLANVTNLMTPMLFLPTSQADYFMIKDFIISKGEKPFIKITTETKKAKDENGKEFDEFVDYKMLFPAEYDVSTNYDVLLQGFQDCYGTYVAELESDEKKFEELLKKYKLDTPAYQVLFEYNGIKNHILVSEPNEDGSYYATSLLFNMICVMPKETLDFLSWELLDFIDKPLFQDNIKNVESITITSKDFNDTFTVYATEGESSKNPITGVTQTTTDLKVKLKSTGEYLSRTDNFRQFYMGIITTQLVTYADVKDPTGLDQLATLKIITRDGKSYEYAFYPYATRRCLYTINGKGEFYVLKTAIDKIISDAQKVTQGLDVSYRDKY